jgi:hypothetical protein
MSAWPPPPDLASIKELVRDADTEDFIADGSPTDEYDGEAEALFAEIGRFPTAELVAPNILPHIERIWSRSFSYDDEILTKIRPKLLTLAQQIARFFGPEAQPQVREQA